MPLEVSAYLSVVSEVSVDPGALVITVTISESIMRGNGIEGGSITTYIKIKRSISIMMACSMASLSLPITSELLSKDNSVGVLGVSSGLGGLSEYSDLEPQVASEDAVDWVD